jgi:FtsP/CotA-like multicopper oxidase with cupredoxin domain
MTKPLSRRDVVASGISAALAAALPWPLAGTLGCSSSLGTARPITLPQPRVLKSKDKMLHVKLTAVEAEVEMGAPRRVTTYTYDGAVPGHTWEIAGGDALEIDLVNQLPTLPPAPVDLTRPHAWTTTNLHTHGLHVSPAGNADNIFLEIPPGDSRRLTIPVPADHPGGIFWYHPHKHGGVAQQVRGGMAGMIIVRGAIDEVPAVRAAREQVIVLQAIELGSDYGLLDPIPYPSKEEAFFPRTQILYTVNGVLTPRIRMYPGEVQRWRLLNAAEGKFMSLRLAGHALNVLAWDGLTLAAPDPQQDLMLSAGNRADVLVKAGAPGVYELVLTPGSSQHPDIPGMPASGPSTQPAALPPPGSELDPRPILTIEVQGDGPEMALPDALPAYDPPIRSIAQRRTVRYTVDRDQQNEFHSFGVDGQSFDPKREPYRMQLGSAEEWTIVNGVDPKLPRHAHVFHIHVNPFKVTQINGRALATPQWRDTVVLTGSNGDSITFAMNLDDFTGRFVQHCHVLSHEDLGMMEALEIV